MITGRCTSRRRRGAIAAVLLLAAVAPARAVTYYLAVDVPSKLGGTNYTTERIVRSDNAVYALEQALPAGAELASLHRRADGVWLLSLEHAATLGLSPIYEPRDVLSYNGAVFAIYLDGSAAGIPDYARIDALFQHPAGGLVLSFDVPVPTRIGASEFMPGQLVRRTGSSWTNYFTDLSWPPSSELRDFAFVPGAGAAPDGDVAGEAPLTITLGPGGDTTLAWGRSCLGSDSDYEIYEGTIGAWSSHVPKLCTTSGALTTTFAPASGNRYYLVVPRNGLVEGSYGRASNGAERPIGAAVCLSQIIDTTCHE